MADLKEYKCPNCAGALAFDSGLQKMKCPYCDSEFDVDTLAAYDADLKEASSADSMNWSGEAGSDWQADEAAKLLVYVCNSCGGEIIADETTSATKCPYCENAVVMKGNLSGALKPDCLIPFKLDKKSATEAFKKHLTGKRFLPKVFKTDAHIAEIKGVYVPFWLFDADVSANIVYDGVNTRTWRKGDYVNTENSHFAINRSGKISFEKIPVDGSQEMDDALMDSVEPFDFSQLVDFQTAYLAGYLADKYNVSEKDGVERANIRVKNSTADAFRRTVTGYMSVTVKSSSFSVSNGKARYALLPVWILNTTWQGKKYQFAMNGQTGKFVGNLPCDKGTAAKYWLACTGLVCGTVYGLARLAWWLNIL